MRKEEALLILTYPAFWPPVIQCEVVPAFIFVCAWNPSWAPPVGRPGKLVITKEVLPLALTVTLLVLRSTKMTSALLVWGMASAPVASASSDISLEESPSFPMDTDLQQTLEGSLFIGC